MTGLPPVGGIAELPKDTGAAPLQTSGSSGLGTGAIAGIVAGAVAAGFIVFGGTAFLVRRRSSH